MFGIGVMELFIVLTIIGLFTLAVIVAIVVVILQQSRRRSDDP